MRRLLNTKGFTIIELLIALTILGFMVAVTINLVNYNKNAVQQVASKLMSDFSAIEMAFTNYNTDRNAYPTSLSDTTFVPSYLFVPTPPTDFAAYSLGNNTNGYYLCTSANVSSDSDYKYVAITTTQAKGPSHKTYYNTTCPATANAAPGSYPATVYLTYWIFRT